MNISGDKHPLEVVDYSNGENLYSDREYKSLIESKELNGLKLVLIPRHLHYDIYIESNEDSVTVYRIVADKNDNQIFRWWQGTSIKVFSPGLTVNLIGVVKKMYHEKVIKLPPGGPIASSPLLIETNGNIEAFYTPNLKNYYFPYGYFGFFSRELIQNRIYTILGVFVFLFYCSVMIFIGIRYSKK